MCMAGAHLSLLQKEYISSMAFRLERTGLENICSASGYFVITVCS